VVFTPTCADNTELPIKSVINETNFSMLKDKSAIEAFQKYTLNAQKSRFLDCKEGKNNKKVQIAIRKFD
jgi:hypothetical protein